MSTTQSTTQLLTATAQQGNPQAIARLLTNQLKAFGVEARVALDLPMLKVMLEAEEAPSQHRMVDLVRRQIEHLGIKPLRYLKVYGRCKGEGIPAWEQEVALGQESSPAIAPEPVSPANATIKPLDAIVRQSGSLDSSAMDSSAIDSSAMHSGAMYSGSMNSSAMNSSAMNSSAITGAITMGSLGGGGMAQTIAQQLQQTLGNEQMMIEAAIDGTLLKITVKTNQVVEGGGFGQQVRSELLKLNTQGLETVEIYKQKLKGNLTYKIKDFTLVEPKSTAPEPPKPRVTGNSNSQRSGGAAAQLTPQEQREEAERAKRQAKNRNIKRDRKRMTIVLFIVITMLLAVSALSLRIYSTASLFVAWSILLGKLLRNDV